MAAGYSLPDPNNSANGGCANGQTAAKYGNANICLMYDNGVTYQNCGGTWYQPQYVGTSVQYVVVTAPR